MNIRLYNTIVISTFCLLGVVVVLLANWLDPVDGDLTRIGGYSENHFGWNDPQESFGENITQFQRADDSFDKAYDIVVYGDSFSHIGPP